MSINVVNISDLTTVNGRGLDKRFLASCPDKVIRHSIMWHHKQKVQAKDYTVCRRSRITIFPLGDYRLDIQLGKLDNTVGWIKSWDWFVCSSLKCVYQ